MTIVNRLNSILGLLLADVAVVSIQNPVVLNDTTVLKPDLSLLKWREENYARRLPVPEDILVVIDVSDTTSEEEVRDAKIPAYARAGLPEAWLTDLYNDRIEIYSSPLKGKFRNIHVVKRGQEVFSKTIPQLKLHADEILG
jgi:Uma2 family endonuclease